MPPLILRPLQRFRCIPHNPLGERDSNPNARLKRPQQLQALLQHLPVQIRRRTSGRSLNVLIGRFG